MILSLKNNPIAFVAIGIAFVTYLVAADVETADAAATVLKAPSVPVERRILMDFDDERFLQNETETNTTTTTNLTAGDCHCDDDVPHCANEANEALYKCPADCHCDDDVPHCTNAVDEEGFSCSTNTTSDHSSHDHADDSSGGGVTDCHCDDDVPHCKDPDFNAVYTPMCTGDCHCDDDVPHCNDPAADAEALAPACAAAAAAGSNHSSHDHADSSGGVTDCHCDDDVPHCKDPDDNAAYAPMCTGDCHCDDDVAHCKDSANEAALAPACAAMTATASVDGITECHCDDDIPHCNDADYNAAYAPICTGDCHCDDDVAHCKDSANAAALNPACAAAMSGAHSSPDHSGGEEWVAGMPVPLSMEVGDCHCDGDVPHCFTKSNEAIYNCPVDCHCDGDVAHCMNDVDELTHSCVDCHCDDDVAHCANPADEDSWACSASQIDCHCDPEGNHFEIHCMGGVGSNQCECNSDGIVHCDGYFTQQQLVSKKPWGEVIVTSLIVNLATLIGVVFVGAMWLVKKFFPGWEANKATSILWIEVLIPMFACGALLATTVFILFPESYLMVLAQFTEIDPHAGHDHRRILAGDDDEPHPNGEGATNWRWGSSIMGGFWIPVIMHACFPHDHDHGGGGHGHDHGGHDHGDHAEVEKSKKDDGDDEIRPPPESAVDESNVTITSKRDIFFSQHEEDEEDEYVTCCCGLLRMKNLPLFISLNIGEAFHNFTDGIFLGTAWLGCGRAMAISIAVATILHELPNQLAGFFVMVNQNGLHPIPALILNFTFGLSIMLGGLMVLLFEMDDTVIGCLLAIGGGTFLHVAIGELLANAERNMTSGIQMIYAFLAFLIGAIPIGLILLNHEHC